MRKNVELQKRLKTTIASLVIMMFMMGWGVQSSDDIKVGQSFEIFSKVLNEERNIFIHLPDGYDKNNQSYPVLFILDAEWPTNFVHAFSTADYLGEFGQIPQMISVGICNTIRNRDMIPKAIDSRPHSGGSDRFLQFIVEELMPFIHENYRVEPFNLIYGGSNAGLFVVYAFLERPETFDTYIAGSPMIGHCPEFMSEKVENFVKKREVSRKFLYMIYGKNDFPAVIKFMPDFYDNLSKKSADNHAVSMQILDNEGHVPYSSLYDGLRFTFSGWPFPEDQRQEAKLEDIRRHYSGLSEKYGFNAVIPLNYLLDVGIRMMMNNKDYAAAIEALKLGCIIHPYSPDAFYYLGLAYENNEEIEHALANYEQALAIDPGYHMASDKIKTLKKKN
jgi:predicted alpha/beta superfamily hydrolase